MVRRSTLQFRIFNFGCAWIINIVAFCWLFRSTGLISCCCCVQAWSFAPLRPHMLVSCILLQHAFPRWRMSLAYKVLACFKWDFRCEHQLNLSCKIVVILGARLATLIIIGLHFVISSPILCYSPNQNGYLSLIFIVAWDQQWGGSWYTRNMVRLYALGKQVWFSYLKTSWAFEHSDPLKSSSEAIFSQLATL